MGLKSELKKALILPLTPFLGTVYVRPGRGTSVELVDRVTHPRKPKNNKQSNDLVLRTGETGVYYIKEKGDDRSLIVRDFRKRSYHEEGAGVWEIKRRRGKEKEQKLMDLNKYQRSGKVGGVKFIWEGTRDRN